MSGDPRPVGGEVRAGEPVLRAEGLVKHYPLRRGVLARHVFGTVKAVDGVDLEVAGGETLGIVGESGSGKSTLARLLMHLEAPTAGEVTYRGEALGSMSPSRLRALRRQIQIVLQDPYGSLDPRMTVREIVGEPWEVHPGVVPRASRRARFDTLLAQVGLDTGLAGRYPHQLSGGQRQRVGIARALALDPEVLILDEPVSALDVSVRAQIVNLLADLQEQLGFAAIFIAHDLAIVRHLCDRVAVMYQGRIVEQGDVETIYRRPAHPYTHALLTAVPAIPSDAPDDI